MSETEPSVVTCECGAGVRLPAGGEVRGFRCPRCKKALAVTANAVVLRSTPVADDRPVKCPICQTAMGGGEDCVACPDCDQHHHRECWVEVGGCGTYGCAQAPKSEKEEAAAALSAWGDTKKCPACGEQIKAIALRCRYCQTDFDSVDPMSRHDLSQQSDRMQKRDSMKRVVVGLFVVSLMACLAPLMAIISAVYVVPRRLELARCGPIYVILAWTAVGLSTAYSLLLLVFLLIEPR